MTTVLITGAQGQLGSEFKRLESAKPKFKFIFTDIEDLDILDVDVLEKFIKREQPDYIINCAAYTNVDRAEENGVAAYMLNAMAVRHIAELAKKYKAGCIHISTDYVFNGEGKLAFTERDMPQPINVYGLTKYLGEYELSDINPPNSLIIRTSWLYSVYGNNFVNTMIGLSKQKNAISVVNDQIGSPTYAADLAEALLKILPYKGDKKVQLFNFANSGNCSWYEFAKEIVSLSENECNVKPVSSDQFRTKAKRPKFSTLNTKKFEKTFHIEMNPWKESLSRYFLALRNLQN